MLGLVLSAIGSIGANYLAGKQKQRAAERAAGQIEDQQRAAMAEQEKRLEQIKTMLSPWTSAGTTALEAQKQLLGLGTPEQQAAEIGKIEKSPFFQSLAKQSENAILQNASATGGLRGGNVESALLQFRPSLLQQLVNERISQFGGLSANGQNATNLLAQATQNVGNQNAQSFSGIGAAQAGASTAQGAANSSLFSGISDLAGTYTGAGIGSYFKNNPLGARAGSSGSDGFTRLFGANASPEG